MKITADDFPLIVLDSPAHETMRFARDELLKYARAMLGEPLRFSAKTTLHLGVDAGDAALGEEGYRIAVGADAMRVSGGSPLGTLYGVYGLLRDFCGCRFAAPGPNGEHVPRLAALNLPEANVVKRPRLWYRGMQFTERYPWESMLAAFDWMAKNGFNYIMYLPLAPDMVASLRTTDPHTGEVRDYGDTVYTEAEFRENLLPAIRRRGLKLDMNHHNLLGVWLPPCKYFKDHPEWYPLIDGQRRANAPQLAVCSSNPEAIAEIVKNIKAFLRRNPEVKIVGVIPQDGWGPGCQCAACARLDHPGDVPPSRQTHRSPEGENRLLSNRYAKLLNAVAAALAGEFPGVKVGGAYYIDLQWPPRRVRLHAGILPMVAMYWRCGAHPLARGTPCRINGFFRGLIEQWAAAKPRSFILYEYYMGMNSQSALPYPMARVIIEEWPELIALGVQGATLQTNPLNYRVYGLNYLAFAAAAWNDHADYDEVLDYWLQGMFGAAAAALRPVFEGLGRAARKIAAGAAHPSLQYVPPAEGHLLPNAHNIAYFLDELTPALIDQCVAEAGRLCVNDRELAQVAEFAAAAQYWKLAADYFRMRLRVLAPDCPGLTDAEFQEFRAQYQRMENQRQAIAASGWSRRAAIIKPPENIKRRPEA